MAKPTRKSVLHEKNGPAALARFDRDVLSQAGVHHLIMLDGINDIAHATDRVKPYDIITADDLIEAYLQIVTVLTSKASKFLSERLPPLG